MSDRVKIDNVIYINAGNIVDREVIILDNLEQIISKFQQYYGTKETIDELQYQINKLQAQLQKAG
jgi:hypothetical protein